MEEESESFRKSTADVSTVWMCLHDQGQCLCDSIQINLKPKVNLQLYISDKPILIALDGSSHLCNVN